jgi:hypothetical protein
MASIIISSMIAGALVSVAIVTGFLGMFFVQLRIAG